MAPRPSIRALVLGSWLAACSLTDGDLAAFEGTAMGPEKLRAVLRDTHYDAGLRARAALRLLDLPRTDVDGRTLLFSDLSHMDVAARSSIVPTFTEGLVARMKTADDAAPGPRAVQAKDAGVELLPMLDSASRRALGRVLLSYLARDIAQRADTGKYKLEAVVERVGAESTSTLVEALRPELSLAGLLRLASLIDQHADPATRAFAAKSLSDVERVRAVRTDLTVSDQSAVLRALGRFRDQEAARSRLLEIARDTARPEGVRNEALRLLESHVEESELTGLLALANDAAAPLEVRVLAASRAGETRSKRALPGLLSLLGDRNHEDLRRRAGELVLEMGVPEAPRAFFNALPTNWDMRFSKAELDAYAERLVTLPRDMPLVALLSEKVMSSLWWNRILALRYFAARGDLSDLWRIRQHTDDAIYVNGPGFPRAYTVAQEAEAALAVASERLNAGWSMQRANMLQDGGAPASGRGAAGDAGMGLAAPARPAPSTPQAGALDAADSPAKAP